MNESTCTVENCDKPTRSANADLCKMHYHRQYRHGSVHLVTSRVKRERIGRYLTVTRHGHPLARKGGRVYAHRATLYDLIGAGPHPCHWCSTPLRWYIDGRGKADNLTVDHLNSNRSDNEPDNLAPSCSRCNATRAIQERHDNLLELGFWSHNDTIAQLTRGGRTPKITRAA